MGSMLKPKTPRVTVEAPKQPKISTPRLAAPTPMPTATDPTILAAAKRRREEMLRRRGRMSTILTDQDEIGSSGTSLGA